MVAEIWALVISPFVDQWVALRRSVIREAESLPRGRKKKEGGCKGLDSNSECGYCDRGEIADVSGEKEG